MSADPIHVVVCMNDKPHPRWGVDEHGPMVFETYTRSATREAAEDAARRISASNGSTCRIARLVFLDEEAAEASEVLHVGGPAAAASITTDTQDAPQ